MGTIPFQRCCAQVRGKMRGREEGETLRQTGQGQALHLLLACCSLQDIGRAQKVWDKDPSQSCSETHHLSSSPTLTPLTTQPRLEAHSPLTGPWQAVPA